METLLFKLYLPVPAFYPQDQVVNSPSSYGNVPDHIPFAPPQSILSL